jgi:hypothetical protein
MMKVIILYYFYTVFGNTDGIFFSKLLWELLILQEYSYFPILKIFLFFIEMTLMLQ